MKKDKFETIVIFRKFEEGDIIALMPNDSWIDGGGEILITSYQHHGQHSGASAKLLKELNECSEEEYRDLKEELEDIGYRVKVWTKL